MPAPVMSQSRGPGKGTKRTQDHQQPPAKRAKLSKAHSTAPSKGLAAAVLPRPGEAKKVLQAASNGFKDDIRLHKVDESTATIASGLPVQDVDMEDDDDDGSSGVVEDSDYDSEDNSNDSDAVNGETQSTKDKTSLTPRTNGVAHTEDSNSNDEDSSEAGEKEGDQDQEDQAPSFGELLLASTTDPIDVEAAALTDLTTNGTSALGAPQEQQQRALSIPAGASLTTLLTQALRTHDKDLLETCLQTPSLDTIRSTIERLDPTLATALLHRVAERLHKRPGRAASLMVWVQWTLVAHGGYLVAQPSVVRKVGELYDVICERARSLPWLLQLKGKLDMLAAQLEVRRNVEVRPEVGANDDEAVIYVEGEDEEEEDREGGVGLGRGGKAGLVRRRGENVDEDEGDEDDEDDDLADEDADDGLEMPLGAFDEDEEGDEQDSDDEDLLDDEAEETDRDTGDDRSEVESEEDEEGESIDDSEEESNDDEHSPVRRSTAVQRPSKKAF